MKNIILLLFIIFINIPFSNANILDDNIDYKFKTKVRYNVVNPRELEFSKSVNINIEDNNQFEQKNITDSKSLKSQAILLYSTNKIDESWKKLSQISDKDKDAEVFLLMANILEDYNKKIDAILYLKKSILKDPKFYRAYYNLGNLYFEDNKLNKAVECYNLAIKYNKKFAYAYYNLANCYLKTEKYKKAKTNYYKAIRYKPDEPDFYYNLAYTYKKLKNEKQAKKYIAYYKEVLNKKIN